MKYVDWQGAQYRRLGMIATSPSLSARWWQQFRLWGAWFSPFRFWG